MIGRLNLVCIYTSDRFKYNIRILSCFKLILENVGDILIFYSRDFIEFAWQLK